MSPRRLDVPSAVLLLLLACGTQGARIQPDDVAPDVANERQEAAHGDGEGEVAGGAQEAAPPTRRASAASGAGAEEKSSEVEKVIAGVPIINYHLSQSYQQRQSGSLLQTGMSEEDVKEPWIVFFKSKVAQKVLEGACTWLGGCTFTGDPEKGGVPFIEVNADLKKLRTLLETVIGKENLADVVSIEPEEPIELVPEVPREKKEDEGEGIKSSTPWGLSMVGRGKYGTYNGEGVHIYILDTGIRTSHSDFGGRAIPLLDYTKTGRRTDCTTTYGPCAVDGHGHGTHCAGSAAGTRYGVAPGARLYGVKVMYDSGSGNKGFSIDALNWISTRGSRPAVASMSLGGPITGHYRSAVQSTVNAGVTVVVAAGNENQDACNFSPSFVRQTITVGAVDRYDQKASFSNWGRCVDINAPGVDIKSAGHRYDSEEKEMDGTSMACPHVAGAAAVVLGRHKQWRADQVKQELLKESKQTSRYRRFGDADGTLWVGDLITA